MKEDTPIGTTIFSNIILTDADSVGETIEVTCVEVPDFKDACNVFLIKTVDAEQSRYVGEIVLQGHLNYSVQESYMFILNATVNII